MIVTTQSGSVYEFDTKKKECRRITGTSPTSKRLANGAWAPYEGLIPETPSANSCLMIVWSDDKCTITSHVQKVVN